MAKAPNDRYVRAYGPILDALREAGGEAPAREIARKVADLLVGGTAERDRELKSGGNAAENEVAWARNNLRAAGLIDGSTRGIWRLTELGWKTHLTLEQAREIGRHDKIVGRQAPDESEPPEDDAEQHHGDATQQSLSLIETIRELPPRGFERLCQRILRELGFAEVVVTGRSGDGGIDGHGVLKVNELVSFQVLFQCKRYQGSVNSGEIRNFRGAMSGRTDLGIFLTTGLFTSDAQREAVRDGVPTIELVDKDRLIALMESKQIGVKPRTVYDVDHEFFDLFRED